MWHSFVKDLKVTHLNVCSLRNKLDEIWCLQQLGKLKILSITETHLDKAVTDSVLDIEDMKFIQLERKGRKRGGCMLYYTDDLKAIHQKDLTFWALRQFGCN